MAAPRDPFRPDSDDRDAPLELAGGKPTRPPPDTQRPLEIPAAREPVKYKKPGTGWVTLLVLLLAIFGAITGIVLVARKFMPGAAPAPATPPPGKPVTYRALELGDAVLITVQVKPRGARLFVDGEPMESNPVRLPRGTAPRTITGQADGHAAATVQVVPDGPKTVRIELPRAPSRP